VCGIAGVSWRELPEGDQSDLAQRFISALSHRGPNGNGFTVFGQTLLVHTRLSIIDLAGGFQPIQHHRGDASLVANGEIYNYHALQRELTRSDVELLTASDSEPALHLYLRHGDGFVDRLHGMYALAIHDRRTDELVCARDPFGIKPLYYLEDDFGFACASEPQALVKAGLLEPELDLTQLPSFLRGQYVAGPHTLLKRIRRVLPGEVLRVRAGRIVARHRRLPVLRAAIEQTENHALTQFNQLFGEVVAEHLQSDVPYGLFLSGGIDSGAIAAQMRALGGPIRTYTVSFNASEAKDEGRLAASLAGELGARHTEIDFTEQDFWRLLPHASTSLDDLIADYAVLPMLKLAECAARDVRVVLCGEGGDEMFGGYGRYRMPWWKHGLRAMRNDPRTRLELPDGNCVAPEHWTRLQRYQARDIFGWLPSDLLTKVDRTLMHYGVEGRVPFLDDRLAAFAFELPDSLKIKSGYGKYLLRRWFDERQGSVPAWAHKQGFTVPVRSWLEVRRRLLKDYLVNHPAMSVSPAYGQPRDLEKPLTPRTAKSIYTLLCFALWHDVHITGRGIDHELFQG
jgi:asparagine synthase (glutamine-hydrolysing)